MLINMLMRGGEGAEEGREEDEGGGGGRGKEKEREKRDRERGRVVEATMPTVVSSRLVGRSAHRRESVSVHEYRSCLLVIAD